MTDIRADVVIAGSGAGGAAVAKELADHGKDVLILEKGNDLGWVDYCRHPSGTGSRIRKMYWKCTGRRAFDRNIGVRYRIGVGGTTTIGSANAVRSLQNELRLLGVNIEDELHQVEQELNVTLFPENLMGRGAKRLREAADSLGFKMEPMPKFIDFARCEGCGRCAIRCPTNAKWTAIDLLRKAQAKGGRLLRNVAVNEVLTSNGIAVGVKAANPHEEILVTANTVILAAGAIGTPVILQNSGIDSAGQKLFCDPFCVVYGPTINGFYSREPRAIIGKESVHERGFMLTNCVISQSSKIAEYLPRFYHPHSGKGLLGIMVKIKDDSDGRVYSDGSIEKTMTSNDLDTIESGIAIATEILVKAGVHHRHIKTRLHGGVHPGGTAAIGQIVNVDLRTDIANCYVSDASVLPSAPGLPPMLTIIALSKRLAKRLLGSVQP